MVTGEDALRTVECLRGRLQAERAASRASENNAHLMAMKLKELEKQLKIEAKARRKAEKKLNFLKKKLESLNIPFSVTTNSQGFDGSGVSSNNSEISCMSSMASTSFNNNQQDEDLILDPQIASKSSSITSEMSEERKSDISKDAWRKQQSSDQCCHGLDESALEKKSIEDGIEEKQVEVDKMALVPVTTMIELKNSSSSSSTVEVKSEKVREVLHTLNHIREILHNTLEKRRIFKVG